jgi:hypothetical protein
MNYGFVVAKDSVGESRTKWSEDGQTILFWGNLLEMELWKDFVLDLISEAESSLAKNLLFLLDGRLPDVNLWEIEDDLERKDRGYYFGSDGWDEARRQMLEWMTEAKDPMRMFAGLDEQDSIRFLETAVDKYNALDTEFRILLYLVLLIPSSSPPRGTEMTSLKFMNSQLGARDVEIFLGRVMLVTTYHKTQGVTGKPKVCSVRRERRLTLGGGQVPSSACRETPCHISEICGSISADDQSRLCCDGGSLSVWRQGWTLEDGSVHE